MINPIMFVGTGSDVGKSIITTGICRLLKQKGYRPAPFKAQNMSLNSYVTPNGLEIGRAQAVQAEACGVACDTRMNPILLKPTSHKSSQIVLHGKPIGNQSAKEYFLGNNKENLFAEAKTAFDDLQKDHDIIVLEGAGSISELNLKHRDIVNMRMAQHAKADVYLIADIDKGGVFASVYGTIALLEPWERALMKGIIINKFRGDAALFEEGKKMIEDLTQLPVLGVLPYASEIYIEDEDSVALDQKQQKSTNKKLINIAVVRLQHLSNYTDFNVLEQDDRVHLYYTQDVEEINKASIVILPGTKNTLEDLDFLYKNKIDKAILGAFQDNKTVIGICGGYQIMGETIDDPYGVEGAIKKRSGLGILPIHTTLTQEKKTIQQSFYFKGEKELCTGYEIHMGETFVAQPAYLTQTKNGHSEGFLLKSNCWGTYMHGVLDNRSVIDDLLGSESSKNSISYQEFKEENYDALAQLLNTHLDIDYMLSQNKNQND